MIDHHMRTEIEPLSELVYKFVDAHQLLKDFWLEVDKTLSTLGLEEE